MLMDRRKFLQSAGMVATGLVVAPELLAQKITTLDFMRELSWGGEGVPDHGHIWFLSDRMLNEDNFDLFCQPYGI